MHENFFRKIGTYREGKTKTSKSHSAYTYSIYASITLLLASGANLSATMTSEARKSWTPFSAAIFSSLRARSSYRENIRKNVTFSQRQVRKI